MKKLIVLVAVLISACGGSEDKKSEKSLFSKWVLAADPSVQIDLTGMSFGGNEIVMVTSPNTGCYCDLEIIGTESEGTAMLSSCSHYGPVDFCPAGSTLYDYTNQGGRLTLCDGACEVYR